MKYTFIYETIIGKIAISEVEGYLTNICIDASSFPENEEIQETLILKQAIKEINEYLNGMRTTFQVPINAQGTPFQQRVWDALLTIPYGETKTYQEIAAQTGNIKASRAVGMANNKNPLPIIIPCHRVVGKNGKLIGYSGGLDIKAKLLQLENKIKI